jgi:hypothetical protein
VKINLFGSFDPELKEEIVGLVVQSKLDEIVWNNSIIIGRILHSKLDVNF